MKLIRMAILGVLATAISMAAAAHEGHEHKVMGTVDAVSESQLDVDSDGVVTTVVLTAETRFERGDVEVDVSGVDAGERVVVVYQVKDGRKQAKRVMLPPAVREGKGE